MVHALHAILRSRDAGALLESHPRHPPEGVTNLPPSTTHSICNQPEKQKVFLKYPWEAGFVPCSARLQAGMCLNQKCCVQGGATQYRNLQSRFPAVIGSGLFPSCRKSRRDATTWPTAPALNKVKG